MFRSILIIYLLSLNQLALAATDPPQDYDLAQKALAKNDCQAAVTYLEKYKAQNKDNLAKHPDFLSQINRQISICSDQLKKGIKIIASMPSKEDTGVVAATKNIYQKDLPIGSYASDSKSIKSSF